MKKIITSIVLLVSCFAFVYPMEKDKKNFDLESVIYKRMSLEEMEEILEKRRVNYPQFWCPDEKHENVEYYRLHPIKKQRTVNEPIVYLPEIKTYQDQLQIEKDKKNFDPVNVNYEGINLEEVEKMLEKHHESYALIWYIDESHKDGGFYVRTKLGEQPQQKKKRHGINPGTKERIYLPYLYDSRYQVPKNSMQLTLEETFNDQVIVSDQLERRLKDEEYGKSKSFDRIDDIEKRALFLQFFFDKYSLEQEELEKRTAVILQFNNCLRRLLNKNEKPFIEDVD